MELVGSLQRERVACSDDPVLGLKHMHEEGRKLAVCQAHWQGRTTNAAVSNIALPLPAKLHLAAVAKTVTHLRCLQLELPFYVPGCSRYVSAYLFFEGLVNLLNQNLKV